MSPAVEVVALTPSRRAHRRRFIAVPAPLYRGDPRYVPPLRRDLHRLLDPSVNPWHRHGEITLFIARRGPETVGRIAAVHDRMPVIVPQMRLDDWLNSQPAASTACC